MTSSKISIKLISRFHEEVLVVQALTPDLDTMNILQLAANSFWKDVNHPLYEDIKHKNAHLFYEGKMILDYTDKTLKDYGISEGGYIAVGWGKPLEEYNSDKNKSTCK